MPKETTQLKFTVLNSLVSVLQSEAKAANLTLNSYLVSVLSSRKAATTPPPKQTAAEAKAALAVTRKTNITANLTAKLDKGLDPESILLGYEPMSLRDECRAIMSDILKSRESVG